MRLSGLLVVFMATAAAADQTVQVLGPGGAPAEGARVTILDPGSGERRVLRCDAEGEFELPDVEWRQRVVLIDHPGAARLVWGNLVAGGQTVRLKPAWEVTGSVTLPDGSPVAGATVSVETLGADTYMPVPFPPNQAPQTKTRADGRFTLPGMTLANLELPPGAELVVRATLDGHGWAGGGRAPYASPEQQKILGKIGELPPFVLRPTTTVRGTLVDAVTKLPVAGAQLYMHSLTFGSSPRVSDANGAFAFEAVPTNRARSIHIHHPDRHKIRAFLAELGPAQAKPGQVDTLNLKLRHPVRVTGRVLDARTGQPALTSLVLSVQTSETPAPNWKQSTGLTWGNVGDDARVRPDGSFAMWMPSGPIELGVMSFEGNRKAYQQTYALTIRPGGKPLALKVERRPGILARMTFRPGGDPRPGTYWERLVTSVNQLGQSSWGYADKGPVWFFPVERWGQKLQVHVEDRSPAGKIELLPRTTFTADPDAWPVKVELR